MSDPLAAYNAYKSTTQPTNSSSSISPTNPGEYSSSPNAATAYEILQARDQAIKEAQAQPKPISPAPSYIPKPTPSAPYRVASVMTNSSPPSYSQGTKDFNSQQADILSKLQDAKNQGFTSLDILDNSGNKIGTVNPQNIVQARFDFLKAALNNGGSASLSGTLEKPLITGPGNSKIADLSNMSYSQLVDLGVEKPQNFFDQFKYYASEAETPLKTFPETIINYADSILNPKAKQVGYTAPYQYIEPTKSDILLNVLGQAATKKLYDTGVLKALNITPGSDILSETRGPMSILKIEGKTALDKVINDPIGTISQVPGELGNFILQSKLVNYATKPILGLATKTGSAITTKSLNDIGKGLQENNLLYDIKIPQDKAIAEFEQGTAGKSGNVSPEIKTVSYLDRKGPIGSGIVQTITGKLPPIAQKTKSIIGIGPKGEKVEIPQAPQIKITSPGKEGEAQIPLAFIEPNKGGYAHLVRAGTSELDYNKILVKGIDKKFASSIGLKQVPGLNDLYFGEATPGLKMSLRLAEKTGRIKPLTDILSYPTKDIKLNPKLYAAISRNPKLLETKFMRNQILSGRVVKPAVTRFYESKNLGIEVPGVRVPGLEIGSKGFNRYLTGFLGNRYKGFVNPVTKEKVSLQEFSPESISSNKAMISRNYVTGVTKYNITRGRKGGRGVVIPDYVGIRSKGVAGGSGRASAITIDNKMINDLKRLNIPVKVVQPKILTPTVSLKGYTQKRKRVRDNGITTEYETISYPKNDFTAKLSRINLTDTASSSKNRLSTKGILSQRIKIANQLQTIQKGNSKNITVPKIDIKQNNRLRFGSINITGVKVGLKTPQKTRNTTTTTTITTRVRVRPPGTIRIPGFNLDLSGGRSGGNTSRKKRGKTTYFAYNVNPNVVGQLVTLGSPSKVVSSNAGKIIRYKPAKIKFKIPKIKIKF